MRHLAWMWMLWGTLQPAWGASAELELLSAGRGERRALRYALVEGRQERLASTFKPRTRVFLEETEVDIAALPTTLWEGSLGVVALEEGGGRLAIAIDALDLEWASGRVDRPLLWVAESPLGRPATLTVSADGRTLRNARGEEVGVDTFVRGFVPAPFPDEPVGPGARWSVSGVVHVGGLSGLTFHEDAVWRLVRVDGERVTLKVRSRWKRPPEAEARTLSLHWSTRFTRIRGGQHGTVVLDLDQLTPVSSDLATRLRALFQIRSSRALEQGALSGTLTQRGWMRVTGEVVDPG